MYSVMNALSGYTYFYKSKDITSYFLYLFLKSSKVFSVSLRLQKLGPIFEKLGHAFERLSRVF